MVKLTILMFLSAHSNIYISNEPILVVGFSCYITFPLLCMSGYLWTPETVNFTFLGAVHFYIPVNFQLCFGVQLNYLDLAFKICCGGTRTI